MTGADGFERAFVATSYLLGRRGDDLVSGLAAPGPEATATAQGLSAADRARRAERLAAELSRIVLELDRRVLG